MTYKLGQAIKINHQILLNSGWTKVTAVLTTGVETKSGIFVEFGQTILGWKIK